MDQKQSCSQCRFWKFTEDASGLCRRSWPRADADGNAVWATTDAFDWCGSFGGIKADGPSAAGKPGRPRIWEDAELVAIIRANAGVDAGSAMDVETLHHIASKERWVGLGTFANQVRKLVQAGRVIRTPDDTYHANPFEPVEVSD